MKEKNIYVTGYFGAPIKERAKEIARERALQLIVLDDEIEKRDGRAIKRLVMMNGEHGYRNQEFEILKELVDAGEAAAAGALLKAGGGDAVVVACGDGVLHDDDSREIIEEGEIVVVGSEMSTEELWSAAKQIENSYHAFMSFGSDDDKREAFKDLIQRQRKLFEIYR